uniref:Protein Wnt n=1 Tax=Anopheles arabiensis TaxID=7173 RepID=A0A182HRY8_ANOAR
MKGVQSLPDVRATCRTVPGLARDQLELCYRASDVTAAAIEGLELGVRECQYQFQWHRWNCSSLSTKSRNPHTSSMLKRGKHHQHQSAHQCRFMHRSFFPDPARDAPLWCIPMVHPRVMLISIVFLPGR